MITPNKGTRARVLVEQEYYCWYALEESGDQGTCTNSDSTGVIVIAYGGEWRGFCRSCWAKITSDHRKTKAAQLRAFKKAQILIPFEGVEVAS